MDYVFSPRVLQCMRFKQESRFYSPERTVMDYELDFCVGCDREMWLDGRYYKIKKGSFVVRTPGQKVYSKGVYDCYMLTLDFSGRTHLSEYSRNTATDIQPVFSSEIWDVLPVVFNPVHFDDYVTIFEELLSVNEVDINDNEITLLLVNRLLHLVVSDAYLQICPAQKPGSSPVDEVCSYIKQNFAEDIKLDDIASLVHLNKNYLARQFKKAFGISPIAYLINIRMEYAGKLLSETNLPVKTVALKCGYKDPSFFNSYFKKTYSVTPAEYRNL